MKSKEINKNPEVPQTMNFKFDVQAGALLRKRVRYSLDKFVEDVLEQSERGATAYYREEKYLLDSTFHIVGRGVNASLYEAIKRYTSQFDL